MKRALWMSLGIAAIALAAGCGDTKGGGSGDIKVGLFTSKTGTETSWGVATQNGVQLAVDEFNAAGGLDGKKVTLLTEDDASQTEQAKTAAEKLVNSEGVVALLGEVSSGRTLVGGSVAQAAGIPIISSASTKVSLPKDIGDSFTRVCYRDDFQGAVLAKFANDQGWKKVAAFVDKKNPYSTGLEADFEDHFKKYGGEVVSKEFYNGGDQEFSSQLASLKGKSPQAVIIPGYYNEIKAIAKQARNVGLTAPLFGGDGWSSPTLHDAGEAIIGSMYTDHFTRDDTAPNVQEFVKAYTKKFKYPPDSIAALAYDSANVLFDAMKRAKGTDKDALKKALHSTTDFKGVTGSITIDETGDCKKPIVVVQVAPNKVFKLLKRYDWFDPSK